MCSSKTDWRITGTYQNQSTERTRGNVLRCRHRKQEVCVSVCIYPCVFVCSLLFACECMWETEQRGTGDRSVHLWSCPVPLLLSFLCIYCNVSLFLIQFSTVLFTSACVPTAPVVFVQPKCAWSNLFCLIFIILFQNHQFFLSMVSFLMCFIFVPLIRHPSPKLAWAFCKG